MSDSAQEPAQVARLRPVTIARADPPSAEVARVLIDYILSGQVGRGEKLPSERRLSELLGVGRSTVREGIKSLGVLGLVEFRHGGGTYLRGTESDLLPRVIEWGLLLGEKRVSDLAEARRHLERVMAGLAADRRTDEQLAAIEHAIGAMRAATTTEEFVEADVGFHLAVAAASNNGVLADMHRSISSLLRVWVHRVIDAEQRFDRSIGEHVPVYEAIRDGDSDAASAAMEEHLAGASARLVTSLAVSEKHLGAVAPADGTAPAAG